MQYQTARSQAPCSIKLRGVKLVHYDTAQSQAPHSIIKICGESSAQYHTARSHYILRGVNGLFLKLLHGPLKGQRHKKNINSDYANKGLHFSFLHLCSRITFCFDSEQYDSAQSQFFRH